jgi:hypothetical protein
MTETPLASVFSCGKFVGSILHRGPQGYEAIDEGNTSHGYFPSQKAAAAALQKMARECANRYCGVNMGSTV